MILGTPRACDPGNAYNPPNPQNFQEWKHFRKGKGTYPLTQNYFPDLPVFVFLEFLAFFLSKEFLVFLRVFPFFSKDFRGSLRIKNPCFLGGFPCRFPKKQGKEDQGTYENYSNINIFEKLRISRVIP